MNANAENTTSTETITVEQWDEIFSQLSGKLRRCVASMPRSRAQWLIGNPNERIIEPVAAALMGSVAGGNTGAKERRVENIQHLLIDDPYLKFENEFEIILPSGFTLDACSRDGAAFAVWDKDITDSHFPYTGLERNIKYMAEIYQHQTYTISSLISIAFGYSRILGGALGGALLGSKYRTYLPQGGRIHCIADINDLYHNYITRNTTHIKVPMLRLNGDRCHFTTYIKGQDHECGKHLVVFFRKLVSSPRV